jgi:adenylate kinase family enzyme
MYDLVLLIGTAGIGKTSTGRLLEEKLNVPYVNYGWFRQFYRDICWKTGSKEEQYAFEQLKKMLQKHIQLGYKNTIVDDLPLFRPSRVIQLVDNFKDSRYIIISLVVNDDEILKQRVMDETRDGGFRDVEKAIKWNRELRESQLLPNEHKIDTTKKGVHEVVEEIKTLIEE